MGRILGLFLLIAMIGCESKPAVQPATSKARDVRVTAASLFTQRYSKSRFADWNVRATAAGIDCSVLLVETSVIMEDSMIEAMHYGAGAYDVYDGGVQAFYRERSFRGVAYRDPSGRVWMYGAVTDSEPLPACH